MGSAGGTRRRATTHNKNPPFFKRRPEDWSFTEYLSSRHPPSRTPRHILDGWATSLRDIASCRSQCHTSEQRLRASNLLARYNEKGTGSDRLIGRKWLAEQTRKSQVASVTSIPGQTINFAPVFNSEVCSAPFTVNNTTVSPPNVDLESPVHLDDPDVDDDGGYDNDEDGSDDDDGLLVRADDLAALTATYKRQTHRWRLSSGREVETVIYQNCLSMDAPAFANSLAPSFVLDLSDPTTENWFEANEWDEIKKSVPVMPTEPGIVKMFASLHRFNNVKTTAEMRQVLATTSFLDSGEIFDRERDFDRMWADLVVRSVLSIWETDAQPMRTAHLEDWYSSYLWSPILDHCFLSLKGITIERKESSCRSTTTRKNRFRTLQERTRQGRRLDGVIRSVEDNSQEYGAMEVAKSYSGVTSTKWLEDSFKLTKAMRDMLYQLHKLVEHDPIVTKRLQVVGVVCAGLQLQVVRMGCWNGSTSVLKREPIVGVPVDVGEFTDLSKLLIKVASMKAIVQESVNAVKERHQKNSHEGKTDEQIVKEIIENPNVDGARLGWAADTPPRSGSSG